MQADRDGWVKKKAAYRRRATISCHDAITKPPVARKLGYLASASSGLAEQNLGAIRPWEHSQARGVAEALPGADRLSDLTFEDRPPEVVGDLRTPRDPAHPRKRLDRDGTPQLPDGQLPCQWPDREGYPVAKGSGQELLR